MPKISVIMPVFNTELYLRLCLNSICNQTLKDIKIICVNDCSPDNSLDILQEYAKKDSRIEIINLKENKGSSVARNTGLDVATGEYIYFMDSDDWIDLGYLEEMYTAAKNNAAKIVLNTNMVSYNPETSKKIDMSSWRNNKHNYEIGIFINSKITISETSCANWAHLYKKSFLDEYKLRFPEGFIYEDLYFKSISELYLDKIFVFYGKRYHYLVRANSNSHGDKSVLINHIKIWELISNYYSTHNFLDEYKLGFIDWRYFQKITDEETFNIAKKFLEKQQQIHNLNAIIHSQFELFCINAILRTENYSIYNQNFNKDMRFCYLRFKKEYLDE